LGIIRFFPEEIESDLLQIGINIHDWWNRTRDENGCLKLSSRRLLVLLVGLRETGQFKTMYRDDWDDSKYLIASILNEIRILRADNVAIHSSEKMEPVLLKSPSQSRLELDKESEAASFRGGILAQLHGGAVPLMPMLEE
jgi:hypothetical protein